MNKITRSISRLKKTGRTKDGQEVEISREEKLKHIHPRRRRRVK